MPSKRKKTAIVKQMTEDVAHWKSLLGSFLVLAVFTLHPLAINNQYRDITAFKQFIFSAIVVVTAISLSVVTLLAASVIPGYFRRGGFRSLLRAVRPYEYALIAYFLVMILSTLQADDIRTALMGASTRNEGLLMMTVYIAAAVIVGRCYRPKRRDLLILSAVAALIAAYGICQFYGFDFLGLHGTSLRYGRGLGFIATMSNRNVASAYFCLAFSVCVAMFSQGGGQKRLVSGAFLFMGWILFYILIIGTTESGYVGLLLSFVILFPFLAGTRQSAARFFLMMAGCLCLFPLFVQLLRVAGISSEWEPFLPFLIPAVILLAVLAALLFFLPGLPEEFPRKPFQIGWYVLVVALIAVVVAAIPTLAAVTEHSLFRDANEILKGNFADELGSGRMFVWKRAVTMVPERLFLGHGPDNFSPAFDARFGAEVEARGYPYFDKMHNEYLQILFDVGLCGLFSLLSFFALVIWSARKRLREPMVLAVLLAMVCFMGQSFFNIFSPFAHPVAWVLWGFLAALAYRAPEEAAAKS